MAKFRADIIYTNGDTEFRIITTDHLTCDDIEHMIMCQDPRWPEIESCTVAFTADHEQAELQAEIKAVVEQHVQAVIDNKYTNPTKL